MKKARTLAFTILEVLTCIAIIAVIAAIMFPVFGRAKTKSKETKSIADLRQIHLAIEMYTTDYGVPPRNNIRRPEFLPYLGGKVPIPPLAPPEPWKDGHMNDYLMYPNAYEKINLDCLEKRGGDASLAHDPMWSRTAVSVNTGESFYLFIRRNGGIDRIDHGRVLDFPDHPEGLPCPGAESWLNW